MEADLIQLTWRVPPINERKYMVTLADIKKRRSVDMSKLTKSLENANQYQNDDEGFWKLERDKAGNGTATFRFLPAYAGENAVEADELPYVVEYSHGFQGPTGRWYIEKCRSTIGSEDPVNDMNRKLWKGSDEDKNQAKAQKRKTHYISQIYMISDPKNPDNNGKVFFYKYGKKIFDKITDAAKPTFDDEKPVNVFDLWEGANFKLRVKTVDKYPNYDTSAFDNPSPLFDDDDEIVKVVNQQKSLGQFVDPTKYKSYEELEKKLNSILSSDTGSSKSAEEIVKEMRAETSKPEVEKAIKEEKVEINNEESSKGDSDLDEDFFNFDD